MTNHTHTGYVIADNGLVLLQIADEDRDRLQWILDEERS